MVNKDTIKIKLKSLIYFFPYGQDLYLHLARNRMEISYRSIFDTYEQAIQAIPDEQTNNYDVVNRDKAGHIEREKKALANRFFDIDYPLLFWFSKLLKSGNSIIELGGSLGHYYYTFRNYTPYPENILWVIAELREAVQLGKKIAKERGEINLKFIESLEISTLEPADIFMTAGTLQYIKEPLPELLITMKSLPNHVLVHNLPTHKNKCFWTLQKLSLCEVPYHIYSFKDLNKGMVDLGYELIAEWKNTRQIEIPFHLDLKIDGYTGYYFKKFF